MKVEDYIKKYNLTDEQWGYMSNHVGIEDILADEELTRAILHLCEKGKTQNPFYKFIEVIQWIKQDDRIHIYDLKTLDEYYDMHIIDQLINGAALTYFGVDVNTKAKLKAALKVKKNNINFTAFRNLVVNIH